MISIPGYQFARKDISLILAILSAALIARLLYLADYADLNIYPLFISCDGYSYFLWAKDIAAGDLFGIKAFMKWPLYGYLLGFWFKVFGQNLSFVYLVQFILGALNCALVYIAAKILFDRRVAFLAALFCLSYGLFIFYEGLLIYTAISLFLNTLFFIYILCVHNSPGIRKYLLMGILLGICVLAQGNIILFGIPAALGLLYEERKRLCFIRRAYLFSVFILGLGLVLGLSAARNYIAEKDFVLIAGNLGINFYLGNNPQASGLFHTAEYLSPSQEEMFRDAAVIARLSLGRDLRTREISRYWFKKAMDFIKEEPKSYVILLFKKIGYLFSPAEPVHDLEYYFLNGKVRIFKVLFTDLRLILPFFIFGIFVGLRQIKRIWPLYLIVFCLCLSIALFFVTTRYRIMLVPFAAIFASLGACFLWDILREKRYLKLIYLSVILSSVFVILNYRLFLAQRSPQAPSAIAQYEQHLYLARLDSDKGDFNAALSELESAEKIKPGTRRASYFMATLYYSMNNFIEAERKFKEIIKAWPYSVNAYYNLGLLYNRQERFKEALEVLSEAARLEPDDIAVHFELGYAYKAKNDFQKAYDEFNFALERISRWRTQEKLMLEKELSGLSHEE